MSLKELIDRIHDQLPQESQERIKPPASPDALRRLQDATAEWLDGKYLELQSLWDLYSICGGEKPDSGSERKLFGFYHRLLTPDQARSAYDQLMRERLEIIDGEGDPDRWFAPTTMPLLSVQ